MRYKRNKFLFVNMVIVDLLLILWFFYPKNISADCAQDAPRPTSHFLFLWGTAKLIGPNGVRYDIGHGDAITAYVDDIKINNGCVGYYKMIDNESKDPNVYFGFMAIYADDDSTEEKDGAFIGDEIHFVICHDGIEYMCNETVLWTENNDVIKVTLSAIFLNKNFTINTEKGEFSSLNKSIDSASLLSQKEKSPYHTDGNVINGGSGCFIYLLIQ